ncbi:hypothetical protein VCHC52A1_3199, partial [Vibrio cholerae HC-52A1]
MTHIP